MIRNALIVVAVYSIFLCGVSSGEEIGKVEFLHANVRVTNEKGEPITGAIVEPSGLRTVKERGSHWGWWEESFGPAPKIETDENGLARMPYPKYVTEKLEVGEVTWRVNHPDYVLFREDRKVSDDPTEIVLKSGFRIAATAVRADNDEPIKSDLYGTITGRGTIAFRPFQQKTSGVLLSGVYGFTQLYARFVYIPKDGDRLWSDFVQVQGEEGKERVFVRNVKMHPGTKIKGRLDDAVPRPIKNGRIGIAIVNSKEAHNRATRWSWWDTADIKPDGTFETSSLPQGEVMQLIATCDGWVNVPTDGKTQRALLPNTRNNLNAGLVYPQLTLLTGDRMDLTVVMEKTTKCEVTVLDPDGKPLQGANIAMWPNQCWFHLGTQIVGTRVNTADSLKLIRQGKDAAADTARFEAITNAKGVAVIGNLPTNRTEGVSVQADGFEHPIIDDKRWSQVQLRGDKVSKIEIKLQPKGTQQLGVD